ncbi:hypothetical protein Curi_c14990 [Gottschalkia acidurici 9a]|uniref:Uncharacterized protein n=1 Tax=Gottschalkia acidurici (strain ATCC 7906 / DSM 604 / BCRC 14475 / CIP 104303 / KCTC 5404 / NCIMB 10678 / 9a) TaxID=1128398 RepID=K0AXG0_GOTA9|nr:hypothetical protein Curi_c14990 [Gottschalkia acidurici 9a]
MAFIVSCLIWVLILNTLPLILGVIPVPSSPNLATSTPKCSIVSLLSIFAFVSLSNSANPRGIKASDSLLPQL